MAFVATFNIYVTHYKQTFESKYSLNRSWQKIIEFQLLYSSKSRFNINKMAVIYNIYEN
jgi:hypothetical protein